MYQGYQQLPQLQTPQYQQQQNGYQQTGRVLVDGPTEAMNRFLMMYPANQLVAGFVSDELFDVNGKQFHVLSVEANGRRNLETFDYKPHVDETVAQNDTGFVSRSEYDSLVSEFNSFVSKTNESLEALNGVYESVSATATDGDKGKNGSTTRTSSRRRSSSNSTSG